MSLQLAVGNAVATLTAVSQACKGAVQLWILHGLFLTANAAGLAYVPYCKVCNTRLYQVPSATKSAQAVLSNKQRAWKKSSGTCHVQLDCCLATAYIPDSVVAKGTSPPLRSRSC